VRRAPRSPVGGAAHDRGGQFVQRVVARGGGRPLDAGARARMEAAFAAGSGVDLGAVRVHTDPGADVLNRVLPAEASTIGHHIYFREGAYRPGRAGGTRLLAHELTHMAHTTAKKGLVEARYEREADDVATRVVAAGAGGGRLRAGIPDRLREQVARYTGHDLGDVRLHHGTHADALNRAATSQALTSGRHIYVSGERYHPGSTEGRALIAHELAHVAQQATGDAPTVQYKGIFDTLFGPKQPSAHRPAPDLDRTLGVIRRTGFLNKAAVDDAAGALIRWGEVRGTPAAKRESVRLARALRSARRALASTDPKRRRPVQVLNAVSVAAAGWIGRSGAAETEPLFDFVGELVELANDELVTVGRRAALHVYGQNLNKQGPFGLRAVNRGNVAEARFKAQDRPEEVAEQEATAIALYTNVEYTYLNPATAGSETWLEATKQDKSSEMLKHVRNLPNPVLFEEGRLHTGVMYLGLMKLPVDHVRTFRGMRGSVEDMRALVEREFVAGRDYTAMSITSTSTQEGLAIGFARGGPGAVLLEFDESVPTRSIRALSLKPREAEQLVLPGTVMTVEWVEEMQPPPELGLEYVERLWMVHLKGKRDAPAPRMPRR
jgi:hypothetical protein